MADSAKAAAAAEKRAVLVADVQLLLASICFGFGFVAQKEASIDGLGPLTFNAMRYVISAIFMTIVVPFLNSGKEKVEEPEHELENSQLLPSSMPNSKTEKGGGAVCLPSFLSPLERLLNFLNPANIFNWVHPKNHKYVYAGCLASYHIIACTLSQLGIETISASASSFVTGMYVIFTPIFVLILPQLPHTHKPTFQTWIAVCGSIVGLFIVSGSSYDDLNLSHGVLLTLGSALFWTGHIFTTERAVEVCNPVEVTHYEMIIVAFVCTFFALFLEKGEWHVNHILDNWISISTVGVLECVGFALAAQGQVTAPSTHVALILATEAVFATIGGYTLLGEAFTKTEAVGCMLMMVSMLIAEMDGMDWKGSSSKD
jgi:drug/metabolite transporter (DMT)-like permease